MSIPDSFSGINLKQALRWAAYFGCRIRPAFRSGDVFVSHRTVRGQLRVSAHRKDAPRHLTTLLNHLAAGARLTA